MSRVSVAKYVANSIYVIGVSVFLALVLMFIFGAHYVPHPDNMLPLTLREIAFEIAALGAIPMLLACVAVYRFNNIKLNENRRRNTALIFFPAAVCVLCLLVIIAFLIFMMISALHLAG